MNDDLEPRLRAALHAPDLDAGFATRVAARALHHAPPPARPRAYRWLAAAALVLVTFAVLTLWAYRQQQQRQAAQQLQFALEFTQSQLSHITGAALSHAVQRLNQETQQ